MLSGMMLSCSVIALAFRPLKPVQVSVPCDEDEGIGSTEDNTRNALFTHNLDLLSTVKRSNEEIMKGSSRTSVNTGVNLTTTAPSVISRLLNVGHNEKYATVHDVLTNNHRNVRNIFNVSSASVNKADEPQRTSSTSDVAVIKDTSLGVRNHPNTLSVSSNISDDPKGDSEGSQSRIDGLLTKHLNSNNNRRRASVMKLMDAGAISEVTHFRKPSHCMLQVPRNSISPSECNFKRLNSRRATITSGVRPLYKDDIFFQANLKRLPQYSSKVRIPICLHLGFYSLFYDYWLMNLNFHFIYSILFGLIINETF